MMGYPSIVVRSFGAVKREMKRTECLNTQPGFQFWNTKTDPRTRGALRKKAVSRKEKDCGASVEQNDGLLRRLGV